MLNFTNDMLALQNLLKNTVGGQGAGHMFMARYMRDHVRLLMR